MNTPRAPLFSQQWRHWPSPSLNAALARWSLLLAAPCLFLLSFTATAQQGGPFNIVEATPAEDNDQRPDHEGDYPAFFIIQNTSPVAVELNGYSASDDSREPRKWTFPANASLPGGATLVVFASGKDRRTPPYATNFLLPCGSTVGLYNASSALVSSRQVIGRECRPCVSVIGKGTPLAYFVPNGDIGTAWTQRLFTGDSNWPRGSNCIGYDSDPICDNLILYHTFDQGDIDTTARVIFDVSGPIVHNGTYGTVVGGGPVIGIPVPAKVAEGAQFQGNAQSFVTVADHAELDPRDQSYTFSIWVRPSGQTPAAREVLFRKGATNGNTQPAYLLYKDGTSGVVFSLNGPAALGAVTVRSTPILTGNEWVHLLVLIDRSSNALSLYRNGTLAESKPLPAGALYEVREPLYLGRSTAALAGFNGTEDDFAIWGRALTAAEIGSVYQAGLQGRSFKDGTGVPGGSGIYQPFITTDVKAQMKGINSSVYIRIPFNIPNPALATNLELRLQDDDGCIVYLNGTEVVRRNAPNPATWNSTSVNDRPDADALTPAIIDLSAHAGLLVAGTNVLAIHGLNSHRDDPRFLICPELCYSERSPNECYKTTNDREFWIAFPGNADDEPSNPLRLGVCIAGAAGTTGTLTVPGLGYTKTFTIPATGSVLVDVTPAATLDKSDTIENKGVHIVASAKIAVYARSRIDYSTDTYLALPTTCLGSEYLVLGYSNKWIGPNYTDLNGSQFGIVAIADDTTVRVTPKVATGIHPAGVPYVFTLNQGQTYLLRNTDDSPADLSGTEIVSDSPVGVFGGHRCANIYGQTFFCDYIVEHILPVGTWSTQYVAAPLATRVAPGDVFRVLASQNGTNVFINGLAVATINRGQVFETVRTTGGVFTSSAPVMLAQFATSSDSDGVVNADPFQVNLQPTRSWLSGYKFCTPPLGEFGETWINLTGTAADLAALSIAPAPISLGPILALSGGVSYRQAELTPNATYAVTGRQVGLTIYGWDQYDSFGHSGGMGFDDFLPPTFHHCPPELTLFCDDGPGGCVVALPDFAQQFGVTDNCCLEGTSQNPKEGTLLGPGDYTVTLLAVDCNQNRVTCTFIVHVRPSWQAQNFPQAYPSPSLEPAVWGWDADPDGDGLPNRAEYGLGTDPKIHDVDPTGHPAVQVSLVNRNGTPHLQISYRRRVDDAGLEYLPQSSSDFTQWAESLGHFMIESIEPDLMPGFERVKELSIDSARSQNQTHFLRLKFRQR